MDGSSSQVLSVVEAARRIYNTPHPSADQANRVLHKIRTGLLKRSGGDGLNTTVEAVAEYLARREALHAAKRQQHRQAGPGSLADGVKPVTHVYQGLLKDYFLAVLLRRKATGRSKAFGRAVFISQLSILCLGLVVVGGVMAQMFKKPVVPKEHQVIAAWLDKKYTDPKLVGIEPVDEAKGILLVQFNYRVNRRRIHSKLRVTLQAGQVVDVNSTD